MKTDVDRILLADDGSDAAAVARGIAVDLAATTNAKLSIVYVLEPYQDDEDGRRILRGAVALAEQREVPYDIDVQRPVGITNPGRRIVGAAGGCGADLVVVGARGLGGVGRLLLGSVSSYVVHHASCSVLVAR